ncbi:hypothetical protein QBC46DRAFT_445522 [Diplogelasinospora grovesii]|uniref:Uncharacterized protein n=1 Tax=Diplogelasinospora grovesii TaxID=303347 RepID=A0AAN6S969_9PEZI|nr:hypothetical protein QBC46DRAFT_445522 [Diplogelasinospora grovesii]
MSSCQFLVSYTRLIPLARPCLPMCSLTAAAAAQSHTVGSTSPIRADGFQDSLRPGVTRYGRIHARKRGLHDQEKLAKLLAGSAANGRDCAAKHLRLFRFGIQQGVPFDLLDRSQSPQPSTAPGSTCFGTLGPGLHKIDINAPDEAQLYSVHGRLKEDEMNKIRIHSTVYDTQRGYDDNQMSNDAQSWPFGSKQCLQGGAGWWIAPDYSQR